MPPSFDNLCTGNNNASSPLRTLLTFNSCLGPAKILNKILARRVVRELFAASSLYSHKTLRSGVQGIGSRLNFL